MIHCMGTIQTCIPLNGSIGSGIIQTSKLEKELTQHTAITADKEWISAWTGCYLSSFPFSWQEWISFHQDWTGSLCLTLLFWWTFKAQDFHPHVFPPSSRSLPSSRIWVYCNIPSQMYSSYVMPFTPFRITSLTCKDFYFCVLKLWSGS